MWLAVAGMLLSGTCFAGAARLCHRACCPVVIVHNAQSAQLAGWWGARSAQQHTAGQTRPQVLPTWSTRLSQGIHLIFCAALIMYLYSKAPLLQAAQASPGLSR